MEALNGEWIEWGVAERALEGQARSGDGFVALPTERGFLAGVVDGLGHGDGAEEAARASLDILAGHAGEPIVSLFERCHARLRSMRGAAMSLAAFDRDGGCMTWLGVGSVEGVLFRTDPAGRPRKEGLVLRSGIVGATLPSLKASSVPLHGGDTLILLTDGVRSAFDAPVDLGGSPKAVATRLLRDRIKGHDDALVLVVRFRGCRT